MRILIFLVAVVAGAQSWVPQISGTTASLRGVSAVNARVAWASGAKGTVIRTTDGGATWTATEVPDAGGLDFRDIQAFSDQSAIIMSAGPGDKSRIYKTGDGGAHWTQLHVNADAKGFFDSMAFWDQRRGLLVGDAVDGRAVILSTADGGVTWHRERTPDALEGEGSFAASGSCVAVLGKRNAWYTTGGKSAARVFRSTNGGKSWTAVKTPIRSDASSAGIFAIAFMNGREGAIVGGDYAKPNEPDHNLALTRDGGKTWAEVAGTRPDGFRSAIAWVPALRSWVVTGPSGSDTSADGKEWNRFDASPFNALSFTSAGDGWAVGPQGRVARFSK